MASFIITEYVTGYDDERFEQIVSQTLHCIICTNVITDPVMCQHNEHLFCKACITRHLMNSQTCPTCTEPLTVDTLTQPSRNITNLLTELKIRCKFFNRGCGKFVELGNLEKHVAECGFAPTICPNHGCGVEVNKQDLLHHITAVCEHRRVECHSCKDIRHEMNIVKLNLARMNENLDRNETRNEAELEDVRALLQNLVAKVEPIREPLIKLTERNRRLEATFQNLVTKVELVQEPLTQVEEKTHRLEATLQNLVAKLDLVQEPFTKVKERACRLEADNVEMKKTLNEKTEQLEGINEKCFAFEGERRKRVAEAGGMNRATSVSIAGGWRRYFGGSNSVEMFDLPNGTWTKLQPMRQRRHGAASVVYNNQFFVLGGRDEKSMEKLPINVAHDDSSFTWEIILAVLPKPLEHHRAVVYNGRMIVIGGICMDKLIQYSASITEISLVPSYASKEVAIMPQTRCYHGVALFGDKIVILGGRENGLNESALRNVLIYDITKNTFQELAPLPYPVSEMATVKWGDDNIIIIGGVDRDGEALSKALIYNITTQRSHMLPDMKYKRRGCAAAVLGGFVIVMGGRDERGNALKSVEKFENNSWQDLPEMHVARWGATAVVG